jgi:hypothetical protein
MIASTSARGVGTDECFQVETVMSRDDWLAT